MKNDNGLVVNHTKGWRLGLGNLLGHENSKWWGTSRWWIQTLVWGLIINGLLVLLLFVIPFIAETFDEMQQSELSNLPDGASAFFSFAGFALPIGVVILIQGTITQEKELGTIDWILSKPVSRTAYLLSKFISQTFGIFVTLIIFQSLLAFLLISIKGGASLSLANYLSGTAILFLELFFYITLTLMLEVISNSRGTVLGVSLGSALGGAVLVNLFPGLGLVTPFALPSLIGAIVTNNVPSDFPVWLPLIGSTILSLIFLSIGIWQVNQKEL